MTTITQLSAIQTMARRFMDAHRTFGCAELVLVAIRWPETETWDCQVFDRDAVERLEEQALEGARILVSPYQVIDGRPEPVHIFLSAFDHGRGDDANDAKGYEEVNVDECITTLWAENLLEVFHGGEFKAVGVNVSLWFLHYSDSCLSGANWREIPSALQRLDGVGRCLEQTVDGTPYFPSWAPMLGQLILTTEGVRSDWNVEETTRPCHDLMPPFRRWASVDGASELLRHLGHPRRPQGL